jgi:predicted HicB family RNase H-like nuclease
MLKRAKQQSMQEDLQNSQQADNPTSKKVDMHASMQEDKNAKLVNLCVRVPKQWRSELKIEATRRDQSLGELIVKAVDQYLAQ